jgi:methionine-rich copper-binding protein CopC
MWAVAWSLVLVAAGFLVSMSAAPAGAHGQGFAVTTLPEDGGVVATPPTSLEIEFSAVPLSVEAILTNADGETVDLDVVVDGTENVTLLPAAPLSDGIWLVAYDVVFQHPDHGATSVAGGWTFVVGEGSSLGDTPALATSSGGSSGLTDPFPMFGYVVTLIGLGAMVLANRHQPKLAPVAAVIIVIGLAPALLTLVSDDDDQQATFERIDTLDETLPIEGFGDVEAHLERTGDGHWTVSVVFRDTKPISLRIWASAAQPTGDEGGTPVNDLAFINTGESGRYDLDITLDAPGRWQVVLLPRDAQFRSTQAAVWIDEPG